MRSRGFLFSSVLWLGFLDADGVAQTPQHGISAADRTAIASCVRESGASPRACIGAIAVVCSRQGGTNREEAEVGCSRREAAVWRERLEMAVAVLAQRLDPGARSRLGALQRTWENYVTQKCALVGELEPAARAAVMQAGCELREVALRSLETERLIRRQGRGGDQRPRLER